MRKFYKPQRFLRLAFALLAVGFVSTAAAQLSGTYTIDSTAVTGGSNFANWADFRSSLITNGVNGAVTVNVMTDRIESQIVFPAITGASSTNTITINGNGKVLQAGVNDGVLLFDGVDYLTIDGLIIRNTNNNANIKGIRIQNGSDYNTIENCTIEFSALTSTSTTSSAFIAFSTSSTSSTTTSSTNHGSYNVIDNNLMRTTNSNSPGPAFGIAIQGSNSSYSGTAQNNTISNNTIQNFYSMAIRMYYTNGNQVLNNNISRANATSYNSSSTIYGVYTYYSYATNRPTKIDNNNLHDLPFSGATTSTAPTSVYGYYAYYNYGNANNRFSISNNTFEKLRASQYMYLGYGYYNYFFDLVGNYANDDDVTVSTSSSYAFYGFYNNYTYNSYRFNSNTIQNCDGGYYWYGIYNNYPQTATGIQEINDNLIQNNTKAYYYAYRIYTYYAQYSNATYPIDMKRNVIKNNQTDYYYTYNIYSYYYGTYNITDNIIENNTTNYYYMYNMYLYYYGNYHVARNIIRGNRATAGNVGYMYNMYLYYNYDVEILSNLIVDNIGYYGTYGIYTYMGTTVNNKAEIRQNTIKINGSLSSYTSHYSYPLYSLMYYHTKTNVIGNLVEVTSSYGMYFYVYSYTQFEVSSNTYYINNVSNQYWYTIANGSATSAAGWIGLNIGTGDIVSTNGHNFAGNWASNRFYSQNNVTNYANNPKDVYGVVRNPAKSDRGAVEGVLDIAQTANDFNPPSPVCAGYAPTPTITFKNNFAEPVTGFIVACSDNGVIKATKTFTNTIAINGTGNITMPPILFSQSGPHVVKFFLLNADDLPSNDTMTFSFNVLKSPGGSALSHNTTLSSPAAQFLTTGKPDITFPDEKMVYDLGAPSTVGYTNADYLGGSGGTNKWVGTVTAKTIYGTVANATVSTNNSAPFRVTLDAPKAWEDSTIEISVKITDLVTNCDTIYKRRILIAPKAVPNAKLPVALCEKTDLIFESTSTVSSGSIDYEWDFGDGTPVTNEASPSHNYATYGSYVVTLKTTTNPYGFTTTKTFNVNITEVPVATIINTNACEGTSVKLRNATVYGGSGVTNYTWDYGDGSPLVNTTSAADRFKSYTTPGGYLVTLTATADGCSNTTTKIVYQFARPTASFVKATGDCLNTEFKFQNNSMISLGQLGSLWDFDDAGNKATVKEPMYNFTTAGTKNVKLKVISEFGCTDSLTVPVTVKQIPTTNYTFPYACSRTATPFTNTTDLNGETLLSYNWNFGDGFTSNATSPTKSWFTIGPRIVKLKTTLTNGCSTEESKIINVGVQPAVNFNVEDRCAGSEVPFTNLTTFTQGNIEYKWSFGDGNFSSAGAPVHSYQSTISQTYTVQLRASIKDGCADSLSKTVTINPLPSTCTFDINGNIKAAKTSPLTFTPTGGSTSNTEYTWLTGDGNSISSNATGAQYTFNAPGKYCITMIARNDAGCECSTTKCISVTTDITDAESMNNAVSIYPNPNGGIFNVTLAAEISGDMTVNVYNVLGELVKTVVVDSTTTTIDISDFASGVYTVKVIADNQIATKKITVTR